MITLDSRGGNDMQKDVYLITGAGTGFGKGIAFGLAEEGYNVIATVEIMSQVSALKKEASERGLDIQIEKLDVTNPADREKAWKWEVDILLNNAGIAEGGAVVDIPEKNLRNQFETNVFGPILLTQKYAKEMIKRRHGKIVFMSSVSGLMADPISGPYGASKFALEAFAESLSKEMQEFNVEVATINPGPYLTGFNDREFEAWKNWQNDSSNYLFDYEKLAFPYEQLDPEDLIKKAIEVLTSKNSQYRNVIPKAMVPLIKKRQQELWDKKVSDELGEKHKLIKKSFKIEPATPPLTGIINKIKDKL